MTRLPLADPAAAALPLRAVSAADWPALRAGLPAGQAAFLDASGFRAAPQQIALLPATDGLAGALLGIDPAAGPWAFGGCAGALPAGTAWRIADDGGIGQADATLGFLLGGYAYERFRARPRPPALLAPASGQEAAVRLAEATFLVRDLVNAPANVLGPAELAEAAAAQGRAHGAEVAILRGEALAAEYPTIAAVGHGSDRPPAVALLRWRGSRAAADAPLVSLCGKGVVFDTGGYDLKPAAAMLRMKKDMGGAAVMLGLARLVMGADLPVRLELRLGCVENMVSGRAMRPLDVVRTRRGLTVEIGNTDAEGRLVLCDLLAEASDARPALIIDAATLTGAARVALGPDLPALFCNDEGWAEALLAAGQASHDPMWRLPLWRDYISLLESSVADTNNVGREGMAGAVVAALFLQRFVAEGCAWAHLDAYCWNDRTRPGRPEGGEAQAMRAAFAAIAARLGASATVQ